MLYASDLGRFSQVVRGKNPFWDNRSSIGLKRRKSTVAHATLTHLTSQMLLHSHFSPYRPAMLDEVSEAFNPVAFLAETGAGRRVIQIPARDTFFSQGQEADSVFYIQKGRAQLTVVSETGKEATITLLSAGDFVGEEAIGAVAGVRLASAKAITACTVLKIQRKEMIRVIHEERAFSDFFLAFLLGRSMRTQADLVDQLFNSSEKRLARILLLMADFGQTGAPEVVLPKISQETLAEMVGTTRSRVSFFMNRFRKLGFLQYKDHIHVHKSLLNVVLHDQVLERNARKPELGMGTSFSPQTVISKRPIRKTAQLSC
jgi:CRP/FNR family cyclic AMP-dependent transcriptional regulator